MADNFTMNDNIEEAPSNQPNQSNQSAPPPPQPRQTTQAAILQAVEAHFIAQKARAIANINPYLTSSVGVAEHPDIVEEVIKLLTIIDSADGMIATLKRITNQS